MDAFGRILCYGHRCNEMDKGEQNKNGKEHRWGNYNRDAGNAIKYCNA